MYVATLLLSRLPMTYVSNQEAYMIYVARGIAYIKTIYTIKTILYSWNHVYKCSMVDYPLYICQVVLIMA